MTRKALDELSDLRKDQSAKDYNGNFINLDVFKKGLQYPFQCTVGSDPVLIEQVATRAQRDFLPLSSVAVVPGKSVLNQSNRTQVRTQVLILLCEIETE